jgi:pimeloyl-ACP methyl ester carboxylesterase
VSNFTYQYTEEETIFFDLPGTNGLQIKAIKRGSYDQPVAVIVHGRPGSGNDLLPYLFARYLYEQGISSLRLYMYDFLKNTRNLIDCDLKIYANDLDTVVKALRNKGVSKLYGVGHSYGGLTILRSSEKFDNVVLWDPTHGLVYQEKPDLSTYGEFPEEEHGRMIVVPTGPGFLRSKKSEAEDKNLGDTTDLARAKGYPLKIISAGKGAMAHLGKKYIEAADSPKKHVVIDDAHHSFEDSDKIIDKLFSESVEWLN